MCQNIDDEDIIGEPQLREDQPQEERNHEADEGAQLESQVPNPTFSAQGTGPPSPLIPQDESPQPPKGDERISESDEEELPYPYPNRDLKRGKTPWELPPTHCFSGTAGISKCQRKERSMGGVPKGGCGKGEKKT